ncbi:MAG: DUF1326 domain-containing protein [Longimicrobiales bacterium]
MNWWADGLLFENCNCTAVCPGHVHFSQSCTHEVCKGFWAIRFHGGEVGTTDLAGVDAVIAYESPQVMIEGGWKQVILVSDKATPDQVKATQDVLTGVLGGPWAVLAKFVSEPLPTRTVPIQMETGDARKEVRIPGILEGIVEAIRGRDKTEPVVFENIYNQIHDSTQVIARGSTNYDDGAIRVETSGTHGLWSSFSWSDA